MSNSSLTIDMITRKSLEILENNSVFSRLVNREYDNSFAQQGAKIGSTLRIRKPVRYTVGEGPAIQVQDTVQDYTTLTVSRQRHVAIDFTSAQMTLQLDDYADQVLKPAISQLASYIDNDIASCYASIAQSVGTPGTTPASVEVLGYAQQKLDEIAAPMDPRYAVINPAANWQLVPAMKGLLNPTDVISNQFKKGRISNNILNYGEIASSQSIYMHTTGTRSTSDTILVNGTVSTQGQSTISIDGGTGSATVKAGDVFTVAGVYTVNPQTRKTTGSLQQFVVTADTTASGGAWTDIPVYPPMYTADQQLATITAFPQDGARITFIGAESTTYPQNLVFHKNAITLATADLEMPQGGAEASRQVHNGISLRIARQWDPRADQNICRVDVLYGFAVIRPELAVRLWG